MRPSATAFLKKRSKDFLYESWHEVNHEEARTCRHFFIKIADFAKIAIFCHFLTF